MGKSVGENLWEIVGSILIETFPTTYCVDFCRFWNL